MQVRTSLVIFAILMASIIAVGCGSPRLGRVPTSVVALYDEAAPDGAMELEIDRDGTIREAEADIPPEALPENVRAAAEAFLPGAVITGAERELTTRGDAWEVKMRHDDRDWELVIDKKGRVMETEKSLGRTEVPHQVLDAADAAVTGGLIQSHEIIERAKGPTEYHVKKSKGGAVYKIVISEDFVVIRKVREARAEIEIPLLD